MEPHQEGSTSLRIKRVVKAPRDRVWRAITEGKEIAKWYAPGPMTTTVLRFDARVGATFEIDMTEPNGSPHRVRGKFLEVVPGVRLVQTWRWEDFPIERGDTQLTIELRDVPGGTEVTLIHEKLTNSESVSAHIQGWTGSLEKLEKSL